MRRAGARGIAVVFHLHNFAYNDRRGFSRCLGGDLPLGIFAPVLSAPDRPGRNGDPRPDPLDRVVAENPEPKYVTFINPQPEKGVTVFARIALELGQRRPEIPLLLVEGRGTSDALARLPLDLSGLANLNRMANTPDPRDFYRVSRAVLMPSLVARITGPGGDRSDGQRHPGARQRPGRLPETLGDAGFVFTIPERYTPRIPRSRPRATWRRGWP